MTLRVRIDDVVSSALSMTGEGEDLAGAHQESDGRIAAAHTGWRGTSAMALSAKLDAWTQTSTVLLGRMSDHAQGLHNAAQRFSSFEEQHATMMRALAPGDAVPPERD